MAPFQPAIRQCTHISVVLRNNTSSVTRVKIKHQRMNADCVQVLLQPLQSLKVSIPDCPDGLMHPLHVKLRAEFSLDLYHENTFDWIDATQREGPVVLIQKSVKDHKTPLVLFYDTMTDVIKAMQSSVVGEHRLSNDHSRRKRVMERIAGTVQERESSPAFHNM